MCILFIKIVTCDWSFGAFCFSIFNFRKSEVAKDRCQNCRIRKNKIGGLSIRTYLLLLIRTLYLQNIHTKVQRTITCVFRSYPSHYALTSSQNKLRVIYTSMNWRHCRKVFFINIVNDLGRFRIFRFIWIIKAMFCNYTSGNEFHTILSTGCSR